MKRSSLRRTPMRRRYHDTGPSADTVAICTIRAGWRCEICATAPVDHTHHRLPRGMGGTSDPRVNLPSALLRLCAGCHEYVERHRAEALIAGWLVSRYSDPASVAVLINNGSRYVYLSDSGEYLDAPPDVAA